MSAGPARALEIFNRWLATSTADRHTVMNKVVWRNMRDCAAPLTAVGQSSWLALGQWVADGWVKAVAMTRLLGCH